MASFFSRRKAAQPPAGTPAASPADRQARASDRFGLALQEVLQGRPFRLLQNVQLEDFLALSYQQPQRGRLQREARARLDFLIVTHPGALPVVGIILGSGGYGRDRRRPVPPTRDDALDDSTMITLLHLQPQELSSPEAVRKVLEPHLR